ncbi:MAG: GspH/FimT family pseudopilin [Pseudomonadota bacterium]|nr:GspH/FimT family pseudopilin [Pseudomonadota bacterium]
MAAVAGHTSATRAARKSTGFTLVEIMVVLLLLGIVAAVVTVRLEHDPRRVLQAEARRLAGALESASAHAQWHDTTVGVSTRGSTYAFSRRDGDGQWHVITDDEALSPRALPEQVDLRVERYAGAVVSRDAVLPLRPSGRNEPFELVMSAHEWDARIASDPLNRVSFSIVRTAR